ncbi:MAG: hypothetical protein JSW68_10485, partial [Burkholderiales bacterium]
MHLRTPPPLARCTGGARRLGSSGGLAHQPLTVARRPAKISANRNRRRHMQIIVPRWLVPVEPAGALERHALLIDGSQIAAIGPAQELCAAHPEADRLDLPGHALLPGLVNLHTHAAMALLRGFGDDLPL